MNLFEQRRSALLALMALGLTPLASHAQPSPAADWPNRPIKFIVPYAAGGFADTRARKVGEKLSRLLGQPVIIENKAGAGGVSGTDAIAKAAPDGYTFGYGSPAPLVINTMLMKKLPYDPLHDIQPVLLLENAPLILVAALGTPAKSVAELVALAKAKPGNITYGSSGVGGAHHLSGEMLRSMADIDIVHVPYKGGAPAASDLMAGHLAMMFEMGYAALPSIQAGKVRALATTGKTRLGQLPQVPTMQEAGVPQFQSYNWLGVIAPAKVPAAIVDRMNQALNKVLLDPDVRTSIEATGGEVMGGTAQAYADFLSQEHKRWEPIIRSANIKLD